MMPPQLRAGQGTNSVLIRQHNQRLVLQRLRRLGEASKADLARAADLTHSAVGQIIQDLRELGLVEAVGKRHDGQRGQPATLLRLDPGGAYGIGVRLDRTRIETALVDLGGRLLDRRTHDRLLPAPEEALDLVRRDVEALAASLHPAARRRILGVGVAQPFNLGAWVDKLDLDGPSFARWEGFDVVRALAARLPYEVVMENDGTAAAMAELLHGHGRLADDFLYLFIGPAIGGGLVIGGECLRGASGNAGDVGMMPVAPSRLASAPRPKSGCEILLGRASIAALVRHLRACGGRAEGLAGLDAAIAGHPRAVEDWIEDCAEALAGPILSARALLDVPSVIVDGDLPAAAMARLVAATERRLDLAVAEARTPPNLMIGSLGTDAGAIGAASLPLYVHFGARPGSFGGDASQRGTSSHAAA